MAMYKAKCLVCGHQFYILETDCREIDCVLCPLCQGGAEVDDIKKPVDKNWGKCHKKDNCSGCAGCS